MDPLLDDTVDFWTKLKREQVSVEIKIFRELPHGFWSLAPFLPLATVAVQDAVNWVSDMCL